MLGNILNGWSFCVVAHCKVSERHREIEREGERDRQTDRYRERDRESGRFDQ